MTERSETSQRLLDVLGSERINRSTDDVLAMTLPLLEQVLSVHERGKVAPLEGIDDLNVTSGKVWFSEAKALQPRTAEERLGRVSEKESFAFEVEGHQRRVEVATRPSRSARTTDSTSAYS